MEENQKEIEVVNNVNTTEEKKGKSVAAMVLGIVSVVGLCVNSWVSLICGIIGLILGIQGKKTENAQGMAKAGIILSVIALVITILCIVFLIVIGVGSIGLGILSSI